MTSVTYLFHTGIQITDQNIYIKISAVEVIHEHMHGCMHVLVHMYECRSIYKIYAFTYAFVYVCMYLCPCRILCLLIHKTLKTNSIFTLSFFVTNPLLHRTICKKNNNIYFLKKNSILNNKYSNNKLQLKISIRQPHARWVKSKHGNKSATLNNIKIKNVMKK